MGLSWMRNWLGIWRNPFQAVLDIIRSIFLGVVFGTIFWMRPLDQLGVGEQFGAIYFSAVFANLSSVRVHAPINPDADLTICNAVRVSPRRILPAAALCSRTSRGVL